MPEQGTRKTTQSSARSHVLPIYSLKIFIFKQRFPPISASLSLNYISNTKIYWNLQVSTDLQASNGQVFSMKRFLCQTTNDNKMRIQPVFMGKMWHYKTWLVFKFRRCWNFPIIFSPPVQFFGILISTRLRFINSFKCKQSLRSICMTHLVGQLRCFHRIISYKIMV